MSVVKEIRGLALRTVGELRSVHFLSQSVLATLLLGRRPTEEERKMLPDPRLFIEDLRELIALDALQLAQGLYSTPMPLFVNPLEAMKFSFKAIRDLARVNQREAKRDVRVEPVADSLPELPAYYRQAFHYQTDGWLSDESAELYDYQVETIFGGGAAAMRRQALLPLIEGLRGQPTAELRILDLAAGTGIFSTEIKHNFPAAHVTVCDLSPFYIKRARENLRSYSRVDFVEANAEALPFKDASFDAIVNIYLFHELPKRVRSLVAAEIHRVLKPGGTFVFVDSMQLGDKPRFDPSLKHFPVHYHEPYYLDYISQDLKDVFSPDLWEWSEPRIAFLSKVLMLKKRATPVS